jgi:hypothetical protein
MSNILKFPITTEQLNNWRCLDKNTELSEKRDCVLGVLNFFEIIDRDFAEKESKKTAINKKGLSTNEISNYLYKKYTKDLIAHHYMIEVYPLIWKKSIINVLGKNHGLIALFSRESNDGHAVIIAVDQNEDIVIIDPQSEIMYSGEYIDKYIIDERFFHLYTFSQSVSKKRIRETNALRKKKESQQLTKKMRLISLNSSSSISSNSSKTKKSSKSSRSNRSSRSSGKTRKNIAVSNIIEPGTIKLFSKNTNKKRNRSSSNSSINSSI